MTLAGEFDTRTVGVFAVLGAASGAITTALLFVLPQSLELTPSSWLDLSPFSLVPGLAFGLIIGSALSHRALFGARGIAGYIAASVVSYLAAYTLAVNIIESIDSQWQIGMLAGLFGSACLTALSALMFPFARRAVSCLLMLASGCLLGALLGVVEESDGGVWAWLVLFAPWQAGYAAAFATTLPEAHAQTG